LSPIDYSHLRNVRLKSYKDGLLKRLEDPHYAAGYLAQVLAEKDSAAFLIALKDVVEAGGGVGRLAGRIGLKRPSLYKILSKRGNPTLETLQEILKPLGLRVSVALDDAA
jgi:probable addiction module antidote protein